MLSVSGSFFSSKPLSAAWGGCKWNLSRVKRPLPPLFWKGTFFLPNHRSSHARRRPLRHADWWRAAAVRRISLEALSPPIDSPRRVMIEFYGSILRQPFEQGGGAVETKSSDESDSSMYAKWFFIIRLHRPTAKKCRLWLLSLIFWVSHCVILYTDQNSTMHLS